MKFGLIYLERNAYWRLHRKSTVHLEALQEVTKSLRKKAMNRNPTQERNKNWLWVDQDKLIRFKNLHSHESHFW